MSGIFMEPQMRERRFKFGENWLQFAAHLDPRQIIEAKGSLSRLLGRDELKGLSFLDIGCGSGLFSLAAREMGARVRSFDFDPDSVACTQALRDRYYPNDPRWAIERASILDLRLHRAAESFRHRVFLGRAAPHRRNVGGGGSCSGFGRTFRHLCYCALPKDTALLGVADREASLCFSAAPRSVRVSRRI